MMGRGHADQDETRWELPESAATPEHVSRAPAPVQAIAAGPILLAAGTSLGLRPARADADPRPRSIR
jgi:hypothetical protein